MFSHWFVAIFIIVLSQPIITVKEELLTKTNKKGIPPTNLMIRPYKDGKIAKNICMLECKKYVYIRM